MPTNLGSGPSRRSQSAAVSVACQPRSKFQALASCASSSRSPSSVKATTSTSPCRIGIAAIQLRPFHEQERTVVRLAHPRQQYRRDERGGAGSSLLARETLRQLLTA